MNTMILDVENWLWKSDFGPFYHLLYSQKTIVSFENIDFWYKSLANYDPPLKKFDKRTDTSNSKSQ